MRIINLPSLNSYRGQHSLLAVIMSFLLITVAWVGYSYVQTVSEKTISQIEHRAAAATSIVDVRQQLTEFQQWLQWQVISPTDDNLVELINRLSALRLAAAQMQSAQLIKTDPILHHVILSLEEDYQQLDKISHQLIGITGDLNARSPSMIIMQNELLPRTKAIITTLNTLTFEVTQNPTDIDPSLIAGVFELRHNWSSIVSEFRLYVANRFGVFSSLPEDGMEARMNNIKLYKQKFEQRLQELKSSKDLNDLLFADDALWTDMQKKSTEWFNSLVQLRDELNSEGWRRDIQLFESEFVPVSTRMKARISAMELEMDTQASADITGLTNIAERLSQAIIYLAILNLAVMLLGYVYLKYRLIIPIAKTTEILKKEAQGISSHELPETKLLETRNLVEAFREMREQVQLRQLSLDHMAHHDALTQLPNRVLFRDRLQHALTLAERNNLETGLMFLDLDRFKQINDSLGHLAGDKLLTIVAKRLQQSIRSSDTVARLSGDEFAILTEDIIDRDAMATLGDNILQRLESPIEVEGQQLHISASIGIAIAPTDSNEVDGLIRNADTAMYEAKHQGKGNYQFYEKSMAQQASDNMQLEQRLREGLKQQEFNFYYQPIIDMKTGSPISFEALLRWSPNQGGTQTPGSFLAGLMETGLIAEVTRNMLNQIGEAQQQIQEQLNIPAHFAFNIAGPILRNKASYTALLQALCKSKIKRKQLTVEITEDTLTEDIANASQFLASLKKEHVKIALDDFGTGQSSLSHVRSFPFDIIKIDKEFIRDIRTDPKDASLVTVIIQLAHSFGMKVVAEGVETAEQFDFLLHANCDMAQGFMISEALPLDQLIEYLRQQVTSLA